MTAGPRVQAGAGPAGRRGAGAATSDPDRSAACLAAASRMLTDVIAGARGTWPRACAWLIRLALEQELTRFWLSACPPVAGCMSQRAKLLMLTAYASPDTSRRASLAWAALSQAGHHQAYELALTSAELRDLLDEVTAVITALRAEAG